jgi:ATP-binding cassette subfamily C protein CydD
VALVGATGAGKSTVANLLLRFIEPHSGSITVAGTPLSEIDPAVWRSQVAWVPQQPHLFHGTIADNIRLAKPTATPDEVIAAATAAHAHEFIERLPQGYDTSIGEQGARLSGGQQQRLAIARAFLKDAPFLILDEATSHLDAESEALIQDALDRLLRGRTVLIIAHRLKLIYTADQVVVMQQGHAIETGKHTTLLAQNGAYRQLVASYEGGAW